MVPLWCLFTSKVDIIVSNIDTMCLRMHTRIFSERERKLLKQFLEAGEVKDETFRMLKMRIKRNCCVE